jgi:hypothetical protein
MGGKKHISDWFSSNDDSDKNDKEVLSEYDKTINTIKLENMFKGTITICIVYAIFGFILLLMSYLSESVRDLLFNKFLPFTIVYIIGSILIIIIMLYYIFSFKPAKIFKDNNIDEISCPDYWEVKIIDEKYIGDSFDPNYADDFKYKCVMNNNIFDKKKLFEKTSNLRMTNNMSNLLNTSNNVNKYDSVNSNLFNTNYKKNGNSYNLYTDVNTNSGTYTETKKYITSNLGIYNDEQRVNNIFSNLRNISLLENNYSIGENGNATDLLLEQNTTFNPYMNISIWTKDNNTTGVPLLQNANEANGMIIFNWNNLTYDILDNYLSQKNTSFIKVTIPKSGAATSNYCLGLIKYKDEDNNNIIFKPNVSANLKTIFTAVDAANKDSSDFLIKNTNLYMWNKEALIVTDNYDDIIIGTNSTYYTSINISGPILQLYDIANYRVKTITDSQLHGGTTTLISPLLCDTVYPKLLSRFEGNIKGNDKNNDIRCAYSKMCGIPWSDLHCN